MTGSVNFFSCHCGGAPRSTCLGLGFRVPAYRAVPKMQNRRSPTRGDRLFRRLTRRSTTQTEALDDRAVPVDLGLLQVVEQTTALADQQQQTTTAVVVVLVLLEVLGEMADAVRQQRDLHLRRAGVALGDGVLGHDLLLGLRVGSYRHGGLLSSRCAARPGLFTGALL